MPSKKSTKVKGLGDVVEKVTEATGIKKLVKAVYGDDCGCEERKRKLNRMFPMGVRMDEEQKQRYLMHVSGWRQAPGGQLPRADVREAFLLYEEITGRRERMSSCGGCIKGVLTKLDEIYLQCNEEDSTKQG
mgnify:CR=1 FL=1